MIKELDQIVLTSDVPEYGMKAGDIGTVVLVHEGGAGFEVEFVTLGGETVAVFSVAADRVRSIERHEIAMARNIDLPLAA